IGACPPDAGDGRRRRGDRRRAQRRGRRSHRTVRHRTLDVDPVRPRRPDEHPSRARLHRPPRRTHRRDPGDADEEAVGDRSEVLHAVQAARVSDEHGRRTGVAASGVRAAEPGSGDQNRAPVAGRRDPSRRLRRASRGRRFLPEVRLPRSRPTRVSQDAAAVLRMDALTARQTEHEWPALAAIAAVFAAAWWLVLPRANVPVIDDWVYAWSVEHLVETGRLRVLEISAVYPIAQILWGALFARIAGFSFVVLRASTMTLSALGCGAVYLTLRELGCRRSTEDDE